uniref:BTB domain-containing protein n=1 Tax=Timema poppense TaxID=170557 RepID=A0A7R9D104_TIMPO|nr:unnamed protein product [Timema poppensis]
MWKLSNVKLKNFLGLYTGHSIPDESTPRKNWKWTDQERSFAYMCNFEALRDEEDFVDVTLACDGQRLKAHKVVLSACSPYFKELFKSNPCKHPILFLRDVEFSHLQSLVEFMYAGEVNVAQAQLSSFLHTAESLQIRGLTEAPQRHKHLYRPKLEIPDYASDGECKADNGGVTSSFLGLENSMDTNNSLSSLHDSLGVRKFGWLFGSDSWGGTKKVLGLGETA